MEDQGIMALPEAASMRAPTANPTADASIAAFNQMRGQVSPKEMGDELFSAAEQSDPATTQEFKRALEQLNLPPEVIDALNQMVDTILANPQDYEAVRAEFIKEGVPEDLLPPTFDAAFFGALNMALDQMTGASMPMMTQQFAGGGIVNLKPIAQMLAAQGRGADTMLAHITPAEARLLRRYGGAGSINPVTGLPEYIKKFFKAAAKSVGKVFKAAGKAISGTVKGIVNSVKKFVKSDIGRIIATVALAYFLGPAAAGMMGVTSTAGVAAVSGFVGSAGSTLLAGGSVKDALKAGVIGGVTAGAGSAIMGGSAALEAGSYTGPTTISGQVDAFTNQLKSLVGMPTSAAGTPAPISAEQYGAAVDSIEAAAGAGAPPPTVEPVTSVTPSPTPTAGPPVFEYAPSFGEPVSMASAAPAVTSDVTAGTIGQVSNPALNTAQIDTLNSYLGQQPVSGQVSAVPQQAAVAPQTSNYIYDVEAQPGGFYGGRVPTAEEFARTQPSPSLYDTLKTGYDEYIRPITPEGIKQQGAIDAERAYDETYAKKLASTGGDREAARQAAMAAQKAATPGVFSRYAPVVGLGMGAAYLGGMFNPVVPEAPGIVPRTTGFDLYQQNPALYGVSPGGANVTYAPPSITPGYATNTFTQPLTGYGDMGMPYTRPQFQVRDPREYLSNMGIAALAPRRFNMGGFAAGGIGAMAKKYPRRTGQISGPGTETSDSIPAMLSDGEFVMTAKAVRGAGGGSRREGAKRMYQMMRKFERKA